MIIKNNFLVLLVGFLGMTTALGVAEVTGATELIQHYVGSSSAPAQLVVHQLIQRSQRPFFSLFTIWQNSISVEKLKSENGILLAELVELEQLQKENSELRAQIGIQPAPHTKQLISSPILSFPYRMVGVGSQNGVIPGSLVLVKGTLVGRLSVVETDYSRVTLLNDQDAIALIGVTNLGQRGIVRSSNHQLVLTEIPQDSSIKTGDKVMTAGEKGVKPGVFIGVIGQEKTKVTDAVKTFVIDQSQTFDTAIVVEIQ